MQIDNSPDEGVGLLRFIGICIAIGIALSILDWYLNHS